MNDSDQERILLVDDDRALLDGFARRLRKSYDLHTACGGLEGLKVLHKEGPIAVVVSDYQMPGMNGITFLERVRQASPETIRVMLTGNADLQSAINAVNQGNVFRFLTKPCERETLCACIDAGIEQYRLKQTERLLLERTVRGSIEVLADVLALANPEAFGRSTRVQSYARRIAADLMPEESWQVETAALLSQVGLVAVPADILRRHAAGETLPPEHQAVIDGHPKIARELLGKIPRMESIAEMIAHQRLRGADEGAELPAMTALGARILGAALDFDELVSGGSSRPAALQMMERRAVAYDPRILSALRGVEELASGLVPDSLRVDGFRIGMVLDQDVRTKEGAMVVACGNPITQSLLARLRNYAALGGVTEPIRVLVPRSLLGGTSAEAA